MLLTFYLLFIGLHVSEGCTLENNSQTLHITAHTGGSVLLPCYCTDLQTKPKTKFTWKKHNTNRDTWEVISSESGQSRNRVQLFNGHSPRNLSLLISNLTEEDGGQYQCYVQAGGHVYITLTVKGCTLINNKNSKTITAHTGGSVLLPCYCTVLHTKPEGFTWEKRNIMRTKWKEISSESGQHRNRVQLVKGRSPGNLSLLISHLTEEDGGEYRCNVTESEYTHIKLTVEEDPTKTTKSTAEVSGITSPSILGTASTPVTNEPPQSLPFVPFALVTVIFLHIIVAVVYHTKRSKDPARGHNSTADGDGDGVVSLE